MAHFKTRNVNTAFAELVRGIHSGTIETQRLPSRNGDVLKITEPAMLTYNRPRERVLFNQARDANPFFHLYESLWMLAGRNDVAPLAYYNSQMTQYSDDGETFNAPYGYRWRHGNPKTKEVETGIGMMPEYSEVNQIQIGIKHLRDKPESRRFVLQMWNIEDDLLKMDTSKDLACNLCVMFDVEDRGNALEGLLNMTVINRSNDLVYGALGANVVHFSFLQEYMACCLGLEVGVYNQISNNLHCYLDPTKWKPEEWLAWEDNWDRTQDPYESRDNYDDHNDCQHLGPLLVKDQTTFDRECASIVGNGYGEGVLETVGRTIYVEPFLEHVMKPMICAFAQHKYRDYGDALNTVESIQAPDWELAARNWLLKRQKGWENKNKPGQVTEVGDLG